MTETDPAVRRLYADFEAAGFAGRPVMPVTVNLQHAVSGSQV